MEFCGSATVSDPLSYDSTIVSQTASVINAIAIDNEHIVVFLGYQSTNNSNYYGIQATSIKINSDNTISVVNSIVVEAPSQSFSSTNQDLKVVIFSQQNQLLVCYAINYNLRGKIITYSNGKITLGSSKNIASSVQTANINDGYQLLKMSETSFVVNYTVSRDEIGKFHCVYCTISGQTITINHNLTIATKLNYGFNTYRLLKINDNLFVNFIFGQTGYNEDCIILYSLCEISSTNKISQIKQQQFFNTYTINELLDIKRLGEENKFIMIYNTVGSSTQLNDIQGIQGVVFVFDNITSTFIVGLNTALDFRVNSMGNGVKQILRIVNLDNNRFTIRILNGDSLDVKGFYVEGYVSVLQLHFSEPLALNQLIEEDFGGGFAKCGTKIVSFQTEQNKLLLITPSPTQIKPSEVAIDGLLQSTATTTKAGKVALLKGVE